MKDMRELLEEHRRECYMYFSRLMARKCDFLLHTDLVDEFEAFCATEEGQALRETRMRKLVYSAQEAAIASDGIYLALRTGVGMWSHAHIQPEEMQVRAIGVNEFLQVKERLVNRSQPEDGRVLRVDLSPFDRGLPRLKDPRSIGRGVEFLNRHLSNQIFEQEGKGDERLFQFLKVHQVDGRQLMLSHRITGAKQLHEALGEADAILAGADASSTWGEVGDDLEGLGFEPGWGRTAGQIRETMTLLADILEAPEPKALAEFLARIPMIFKIVILSPHGYFGQSGVLGMPDTGGQVVYILDQVRALEREMKRNIHEQGLDIEPGILIVTRLIPEAGGTTCDRRIEPVLGTEHARILRVPFRNEQGDILPHWISRFNVWPCLERFADEVEKEIHVELGGRIDFIIGNYSDGNLVSTLLSERLGVTQCTIAHALEKTKYLHSALYWREHEQEHHFSCQFTADLIAMNTADFIITSSYQEIAGTADSVGQYESYGNFTMPGLYRVLKGIDVLDPKFNIVSPGVNDEVFFPYSAADRRISSVTGDIRGMIHGGPDDISRGKLEHPDKPLLCAMSRLDTVKNVLGFLELYAKSDALREKANVLVVGGYVHEERSSDEAERDQIRRLHGLFDQYGLDGQVRWLEMQTDKNKVGEIYRCVADTRGAFVQPALFEAFGLTVLEAMSSALPTFATRYGGPLEIIEHGKSGFHIDPNHPEAIAELLVDFLARSAEDPSHWETISQGGVDRVESRYTWKLYAQRLLSLSRIYGFWKFISGIRREATRRYLEMFYELMYKPHAREIQLD